MAVVWRGFDLNLEREVAIKEPVIPAGVDEAAHADLSARFVREGKAAAKLNHPGIVTIHAADVFDGRPAIVMELIEGETLSTVLDRGPLAPAAALAILDQLLDAVAYAHERGVVHRDIKPDNVFVTHDGRVKLADFGIAHVGSSATLTQAGTVMGTPGYMAPEQVTGQPIDARADIFAIGSIAYEMLAGHNPFGATDGIAPTTVMYRIVHEQPPSLPEGALAGLPVALAPVIGTALAKDPADRFCDANAFRAALGGAPIVTGAMAGVSGAPAAPPSAWGSQAAAATVVGQQGGMPSWMPYAVVGGIAVVLLGGMLMMSGGGMPTGGGAGLQRPATEATAATEEPAAAPVAPVVDSTGPDAAASKALLKESYTRLKKYGGKSGKISDLADRINKEIGRGSVSAATVTAAERLVRELESARDALSAETVEASMAGVQQTHIELYGNCIDRAQALADGAAAFRAGSDFNSAFQRGHDAKVAYDATYSSGRP
jgi:serine/threonine-protein kinase